jgi:hypothetical protein
MWTSFVDHELSMNITTPATANGTANTYDGLFFEKPQELCHLLRKEAQLQSKKYSRLTRTCSVKKTKYKRRHLKWLRVGRILNKSR